tara:strand:+ start:2902 stop:4233 length:1332 start_codon:yes stop_codon:yes gene_type:complete
MKIKCNCNTQAPILNESKAPRKLLSSNLQYYIDNDIPLTESNNGMNSTQYLEVIKEARSLYSRNLLELDGTDLLLIRESNLGNYAKYKGREVPLDFPIKLKEGLYKIYRRNSSKKIIKEFKRIDESTSWYNVVLDVAGIAGDAAYGVGFVFDLGNAIDYAVKGNWIFSGLSLISMIPAAGDIVGKGGKLAIWITKGLSWLSKTGKIGDKIAKALPKIGKETADSIKKLQTFIRQNEGQIDKLFEALEKSDAKEVEPIKKYLPEIREGINIFAKMDPNKPEEIMNESKPGLWDNIRAKRKKVGKSGMSKPGTKAYKLAKKAGDKINKETNENIDEVVRTQDLQEFMNFLKETCKPENIEEAKYQGRTVTLNKPMRGDSKKFKVYVNSGKKNADGTIKVKKVEFGAKGMNIKKNNPKRRKAFRARHNCANPGPKTKARYWSCRKW